MNCQAQGEVYKPLYLAAPTIEGQATPVDGQVYDSDKSEGQDSLW